MVSMTFRFLLFYILPCFIFSCSKATYVANEEPISRPCVRPTEEIAMVTAVKSLRTRLASPLIVIDAGHGGKDNGTESKKGPKFYEKHLTLTTAEFLEAYLKKMGFRTAMTRKDDLYLELKERAEFANARKPALFVSVHYNSAPNKQAEGVEVYYYNGSDDKKRSQSSKDLAKAILDAVLVETKAKSRGIKEGNFAVIRETTMPAIIIEGGFMTNEGEMSRIRDKNYMSGLAKGIAQGINEYLYKSK